MAEITTYPPCWPSAVPLTGHCGACQIQAMLAARGIHKEVKDLYVSRIQRDGFGTGISWDHTYTMPWDITLLLARYGGIRSKTRITRGTSLLPVALAAFERGHPLIILIRSTVSGGLHWISLWGYDKSRDMFIAYDSQAATREGGLGNTEYSPAFLRTKLPLGILWAIEVTL